MRPGQTFLGGGPGPNAPLPGAPTVGIGRRGPINNWTDAGGNGAIMAMDPGPARRSGRYAVRVTDGGMLTTATDLLFSGGREGYFMALDARKRNILWKASLGAADRDGAGDVPGRRQAVRLGHRRPRARDLRVRD